METDSVNAPDEPMGEVRGFIALLASVAAECSIAVALVLLANVNESAVTPALCACAREVSRGSGMGRLTMSALRTTSRDLSAIQRRNRMKPERRRKLVAEFLMTFHSPNRAT
jgi:hypothetical protein